MRHSISQKSQPREIVKLEYCPGIMQRVAAVCLVFVSPWSVLCWYATQDAGVEMKREDETDFMEQRLAEV